MLLNEQKESNKMEMLTVVLVAMTVLVIAWSAYQATLWGGIQTFKLADANAANRQATELNLKQGQYSMIDSIMFMQYVNAHIDGNQERADFYFERFRPDFKPAVQAWLDTDPFNDPGAPPHPFIMEEYQRTFAEQAEQAAQTAKSKRDEAQQANQNSDNYVLYTVIYTAILFIGSITTKFSSNRLNRICLMIGAIALVAIVTSMFVFMPVATE
jgi:hypothetical protein